MTPNWSIAGASFLTMGFSRGIHSAFGVFYVALLDAFSWTRGATAGVYSLNLLVDAALSPVVGHLLDRHGPRRIVASGCLFLATGLFLSSLVSGLWAFYLFFGLISAVGFAFTGMVPHVVLVSQWFTSMRGSSLGVVYASSGIGILLVVPLSQWLISTWGWQQAFRTLAAGVLILLLPCVWVFYRSGPRRESHSRPQEANGEKIWTARVALKSLQFWSLFLARILAASGVSVIITHQVAHVVDIGYSRLLAATVFGLMGITSTLGRLVFGFVSDLLSRPGAYTLNILLSVGGVITLTAARDPSQPWLLYLYVILFGIGFGSRAVILSAISADIFSGKGFGSIYGYFTVSVGAGGAVSSWLGGHLYDLTGSYFASFTISVALLLLSALSVWLPTLRWVRAFDERLWQEAKVADQEAGRTRQR